MVFFIHDAFFLVFLTIPLRKLTQIPHPERPRSLLPALDLSGFCFCLSLLPSPGPLLSNPDRWPLWRTPTSPSPQHHYGQSLVFPPKTQKVALSLPVDTGYLQPSGENRQINHGYKMIERIVIVNLGHTGSPCVGHLPLCRRGLLQTHC